MIVFPFSFFNINVSPLIEDGLILNWDIQNESSYTGSGTTITDLRGNSNGSLVGSAEYTSGTPNYIEIQGSTSEYIVTDTNLNPFLSPVNTGTAISFFIWVYPTDNGIIVNEQGTTIPATDWHDSQIEIVSGQLKYRVWELAFPYITSSTAIVLNEWNYIGLTYSGTTLTAYLNGENVGTASLSRLTPYNNGNNRGLHYSLGAPDGSTNMGDGTGSNMRLGAFHVYNRGLSSVEVLQNYDKTKSHYLPNRGTLENPGISAQDIYDSGQTESGWYYVQTSTMAQSRQVYCNMTDNGGGWMLISYTPSFNNTTGGLGAGSRYPNTWENGEGTFNRLRVSTMDLWYHNSSAQCTQVMKMATTTYNQIPLLDNMEIANKVVYGNPGNLSLSTVSNYPAFVNNTPMTGTWSPIKGHTLMSTSLDVNAPGDWIFVINNSWWTVCGPSTQLSPEGRSGNAQGTGSWTNPSNSSVYGVRDVTAGSGSLRSDIQTYAVFIK